MDWRTFKILGAVLAIIIFGVLFLAPPGDFKPGTVTIVKEGASAGGLALQLKKEGLIRSAFAFKVFAVLYGGANHLIPNEYLFEKPLPVFIVAKRIIKGQHGFESIKVTIPEGFNNEEIAEIADLQLKNFDKNKFLSTAKAKEGYLFPDTYFFDRNDTEKEVIDAMGSNYIKKIKEIASEIQASGKSERDIIIMASIIEREANGDEDRGFISGILWKRLSINMPLQADAAPETYEKRGLPVSPIGNPGLKAIRAAMNPQSSNYLYYLHDKDGNIHYARSFDEHRANRLKYLNQ